MEKREMVIKALSACGTSTAKQISAFAKRKFDYDITPTSVSGSLRWLVSRGLAGSSKDEHNQTRYWLNTCSWKEMADAE